MLTAVLCYAQPFKSGICTASEKKLKLPFSVTPIRIIPVNKTLRNLGRIQFIAKSSSIYTKICLCHKHKTFWRSWLQLSSRTHFAKIEDKKKLLRKNKSKNLTAGVFFFKYNYIVTPPFYFNEYIL